MEKLINMKAYIYDANKIVDVITVDYLNGTIKYYDDNKNCISTNLCDVSILLGTGLKDVNNKEIFEGDIIERINEPIGNLSIIVRRNCSNSLGLKIVGVDTVFSLALFLGTYGKVIGNVFIKPNYVKR